MQALRKIWIRILISLFAGGATQELIHISTGDPNRPEEFNFSIGFAAIFFAFFTLMVHLTFKPKKTNSEIEDIGKNT